METCADVTCTEGILVEDPASYSCPEDVCDINTCCLATCAEVRCERGYLREDPETYSCPDGGCDIDTCCYGSCEEVECEDGYELVDRPHDYTCPDGGCDVHECCVAGESYVIPMGGGFLLLAGLFRGRDISQVAMSMGGAL